MTELSIPIVLVERAGLQRSPHYVRIGVPLPRGAAFETTTLEAVDARHRPIPHQFRVLARWPDCSIKWLLVDAAADVPASASETLFIRRSQRTASHSETALRIVESAEQFEIDTGVATFAVSKTRIGPLASVRLGDAELLAIDSSSLELRADTGELYVPKLEAVSIEEHGPLRVCILAEGSFASGARTLRFSTRTVFLARSGAVRFEIKLLNPHVAHHRGGLWDLGDPGSYHFRDLSLRLPLAEQATGLRWKTQPSAEWQASGPDAAWALYQDSSGGEHWDSDNHVDQNEHLTVAFRGFRVRCAGAIVAEGERATPCLVGEMHRGWIAATVQDFWQNFPKALRWERNAMSVGIFPMESTAGFELQGGEQKRHTVLLEFGPSGKEPSVSSLQIGVAAAVDPSALEVSKAIPYFAAQLDESSASYARYVDQIVEGSHSFFNKREIIDEYGWRNFGDLYADHEAVNHRGAKPMVSHYNNQYDFILGAFLHFQRTGDARWGTLMRDAALHMIDIDIYHTKEDRPAFNGGLFWHTDHYKPARTCTHRTYSAHNSAGSDYGGGPSNEQNYTSGLQHYYYLTGDEEARATVLGLAEWVIAMDDGAGTLFSIVDSGATGLASKTVSPDFHKPGRGAGNSINALLDGYALSRDRRFVRKAEELIQRCIHPRDDIEALQLREPEYRWSYLVFLQVLGKYLDQKSEWGEIDYHFYFARDSLLHYARWIAENELPYKDLLHKVEIPTETWPAHDVRKAHVLYLGAKYGIDEGEKRVFRERARFFFERCIADVTSFATAHLTRPLVILCVYGGMHAYFQKYSEPGSWQAKHNYDFGAPVKFVPQRQNLGAAIRLKKRVLVEELRRIARDKVHGFKHRWARR